MLFWRNYLYFKCCSNPRQQGLPPIGYVELKSKQYDYASRFFRAYLDEDEKQPLDNVNR